MNLTTAINATIKNHQDEHRMVYQRIARLHDINPDDVVQLQACFDLMVAHKMEPIGFRLNAYGEKPEILLSFAVTDSLAEMATVVLECLSPYNLENWKSYDAADGSSRTFFFEPRKTDPFEFTITFHLTETATCQRIIVGYEETEECIYTKTRKPITKIVCS